MVNLSIEADGMKSGCGDWVDNVGVRGAGCN
jgi:hypothetical protein